MTATTVSVGPTPARHPISGVVGPIVLATNGSSGTGALHAASRLAARTGAHVVVVSAVEPVAPVTVGISGTVGWAPDLEPLLAMQRERVLRQLREELGGDVAWPVVMRVDSPARAVEEAARERRASLVVMGVGRHDLAARLLGEEAALRAIRRASVPVLAVPDTPFPVPPRIAVVGVDFSPSSVRAARAALDLLADGGTLYLVHVWARTVVDHPAMLAQDDAYERALPERLAAVERALLDRARDVTMHSTWLVGETAGELVRFAETHAADFIAAGKRGHGLVERLLVGQVTTKLIRTAPCAVLVTPEPLGAERVAVELALTGTAESRDPAEWATLLDAFSRRNAGRRTALEVDDPALGAQAQEAGYTLLGATYDHHDGRVALMLGDPTGRVQHLTRLIQGVTSLGVRDDGAGRDVALSVRRDDGQTLLTFLGDPP